MTKRTLTILALALVVSSCQEKVKEEPQGEQPSTTETTTVDVPYKVASRYFVKNTVTEVANPKIESLEAFEEVFGAAAVMGEDGMPTMVDFTKEYVIAVVLPETDMETDIEVVSLVKNEMNEVVLTYKVVKGEQMSFTIRPNLALIVDKMYDGTLVLNEMK